MHPVDILRFIGKAHIQLRIIIIMVLETAQYRKDGFSPETASELNDRLQTDSPRIASQDINTLAIHFYPVL